MTPADVLLGELRGLGAVGLWAVVCALMLAAHTLSAYGGTWRPR